MASIGIIANPASGKDIRRLVSYATVIDNAEKSNMIKRIILAAQSLGIDDIYLMPESSNIGALAIHALKTRNSLRANVHTLDFFVQSNQEDSTLAAREMEQNGVGCIVVLGGDGTSRAVAKGVVNTPIIPVSTGTNNVYPQFGEGTVIGMAAAIAARMKKPSICCVQDKRIEIYRNNELVDIALIDAVVSDDVFVGARAIWNISSIHMIVASRAHPANIGFSAIAGCVEKIQDTDQQGVVLRLGTPGKRILAPVAAGILEPVSIVETRKLELGEPYHMKAEADCMIALDGEREVMVRQGQTITFVVQKNGPLRVNISAAIEQGCALGLFEL